MVIDHQHIGAAVAGVGNRFFAGGAAVQRDDEAGAGVDQLVHGAAIGAIALEDAVGNVHLRIEAEMAQEAQHQRAGTSAVDVVIAEQRHFLPGDDGVSQPVGQGIHIGQGRGIGHQGPDGGVEIGGRVLEADIAARQDAAENIGHAAALADRRRHARRRTVQTIHPGPSRDRP